MTPVDNMNKFAAVGIGRNCVDHLAVVKSMPRVDAKVPMLDYRLAAGGQSSTAMVALSRLGLRVACAGVVGDDWAGRYLIGELEKEGVDASNVVIEKGMTTPVALILVDEKSGRRTIAYLDSAKGRLELGRLNREKILSADCLLIDPYGTRLGLEISREAKEKGIIIIYDAEHSVDGFREMISSSDYVVGSTDVIETLGARDPNEALEKLLARGPRAAVITMGQEGCVALSSRGFISRPAFEIEAVDTTAAGDAFHAGFAYGVLRNWPLEETLRFASALGALVCRGLGGRETLPDLSEVQDFLSRHAD